MSRVEFYETETMGEAPAEWRWRVKAGNNENVASGEGYTTKRDALRGFLDAKDAMDAAYSALMDK